MAGVILLRCIVCSQNSKEPSSSAEQSKSTWRHNCPSVPDLATRRDAQLHRNSPLQSGHRRSSRAQMHSISACYRWSVGSKGHRERDASELSSQLQLSMVPATMLGRTFWALPSAVKIIMSTRFPCMEHRDRIILHSPMFRAPRIPQPQP